MRKQRAFRTLTDGEIDQIAEWLRQENYDVVLERVQKPRPEGFGLTISRSPLERLFQKTNVVKKINEQLTRGEKLTVSGLDAITSGEATASEGVQEVILEATHELAKDEENSATQLLALQRLADFPERVAIRDERLQLEREREDRLKAMQAHKVAMDLRREERAERRENRSDEINVRRARRDNEQNARAHKHLELSGKRLRLSMKSLALRRKQHRDRIARLNRTTRDTELTEQCDALGPYARNLEEIRERARKHFRITPEESARRAELRKAWISQNAENSSPEGTPDDSPATSVPGNLATIDSVPERRLNSSMAESISPRPTISDSQFSIPNSQFPISPQPN